MLRTFSVIFVLLLFGCVFGPLCLLLALLWKNQKLLYWLGRIGCKLGLIAAGIKVEVRGLELLQQHVPELTAGNLKLAPQDDSKRRRFPQRSPEDGEIDWSWDSNYMEIGLTEFIRV